MRVCKCRPEAQGFPIVSHGCSILPLELQHTTQVEVGLYIERLYPQGCLVMNYGCRKLLLLLKNCAEIVMGFRLVRLQLQGMLITRAGFMQTSELVERIA